MVSNNDNGVQIINITNPYNPTPVQLVMVQDFTTLSGARSIAITTMTHQRMPWSSSIDDGVQIIDITTPPEPCFNNRINMQYWDMIDNQMYVVMSMIYYMMPLVHTADGGDGNMLCIMLT